MNYICFGANRQMFFCNQKNEKFRGSDSPGHKTASQGRKKGWSLYHLYKASFVVTYFKLLYRRTYSALLRQAAS